MVAGLELTEPGSSHGGDFCLNSEFGYSHAGIQRAFEEMPFRVLYSLDIFPHRVEHGHIFPIIHLPLQ